MLRKLLCLLLTVFSLASLTAQNVSVKKAALLSLIVPGAGQYYVGANTRAGVFLGSELMCWFAYMRLGKEVDWEENAYQKLASVEADIPVDSPEWLYTAATSYYSSDLYNQDITQDARNYYLLYKNDPVSYQNYLDQHLLADEYQWSWDSKDSWRKYHRMRNHKQDLEIYAKLAVGAALFNRMMSVIDAARDARKINLNQQQYGSLTMQPDLQKKGLSLNYEYRF